MTGSIQSALEAAWKRRAAHAGKAKSVAQANAKAVRDFAAQQAQKAPLAAGPEGNSDVGAKPGKAERMKAMVAYGNARHDQLYGARRSASLQPSASAVDDVDGQRPTAQLSRRERMKEMLEHANGRHLSG
jgi:hypothetical protein